MAYVAISNELVDSTRRNIREMRDNELTALPTPLDTAHFPSHHAVPMHLAWDKFADQRDEFPEDWKTQVSAINLSIRFTRNDIAYVCEFYLRPNVGEKFTVPHLSKNNYDSVRYMIDDTHPLALTVCAPTIAHCLEATEVRQKWEEISKKVTEFLRASKSLNEALKLWPALALYVSDQYIQRVNNNAKREAKISDAAAMLASIDTDSITAAAVSAKLST